MLGLQQLVQCAEGFAQARVLHLANSVKIAKLKAANIEILACIPMVLRIQIANIANIN